MKFLSKSEKILVSVFVGLFLGAVVGIITLEAKKTNFRKEIYEECLRDGHKKYVCFAYIKSLR